MSAITRPVQGVREPLLTPDVSNIFAILLLPLLCAIGLLGNLLVCMAIWFDRRLHNVTNYFLFSLALADLLVCSLVMPMSLIVEVRHGVWTWSFSMCLLYVYADVFLCTASIVHMSVISLDRYLGISKPLKARNKSKTMITLKIVFVWIATMLISCPIAIAALIDPANILNDDACTIANRYYMIYGSTFAFLIPFLIMAVTYVRTTRLLKQQTILISHHNRGRTATATAKEDRTHPRTFILRRACAQRNCNLTNIQNGTPRSGITSTDVSSSLKTTLLPAFSEGELELPSETIDESALERSRLRTLRERTATAIFAMAARIPMKEAFPTNNAELANEHKATRVLAVVFACFFICWTPFFINNFAAGFCGVRCAVPPTLASFFLWLGYFSSTINPLIYTIFNRRFRQAFLRILRCQCTHSLRSTYVSSYFSRRMDNDACTTIDRSGSRRERELWNNVGWKKNSQYSVPARRTHEFRILSAQASRSSNSVATVTGSLITVAKSVDGQPIQQEQKMATPILKRSQTNFNNSMLLGKLLRRSLSLSDIPLLQSTSTILELQPHQRTTSTRIVLLNNDLFNNALKETFL